MRHADALAGFLPATAAPLSPLAPTAPVAPAQPLGGARGGFGAGFRALDGEIRDYIAHGDRGGAGVPALSAAGRAWLATQPAAGAPLPTTASLGGLGAIGAIGGADDTPLPTDRQAFVGQLAPHAEAAGRTLGVAPDILVAQAALETGWGQRPLRNADGTSTHNLFGVKAGGGWQGATADALTTEVEQGVPVKRSERFRRYDDAGDAFRDFTQLLQTSPRYQGALNTGGDARAYAEALARGGYATDPNYADKLVGVVNRLRAR